MNPWVISEFDDSIPRAEFSCGEFTLDRFWKEQVGQYHRKDIARTYVLTSLTTGEMLGYYTLSAGGLPFQDCPMELAKKLPKHPVPILLLARLAVSISAQKQGIGSFLLMHALAKSMRVADQIGVRAVVVDALHDQAKTWYMRFGFIPFLNQPLKLFLTIETIRGLKL